MSLSPIIWKFMWVDRPDRTCDTTNTHNFCGSIPPLIKAKHPSENAALTRFTVVEKYICVLEWWHWASDGNLSIAGGCIYHLKMGQYTKNTPKHGWNSQTWASFGVFCFGNHVWASHMINSILLGAVPFVASGSRKNEPLEPTKTWRLCDWWFYSKVLCFPTKDSYSENSQYFFWTLRILHNQCLELFRHV